MKNYLMMFLLGLFSFGCSNSIEKENLTSVNEPLSLVEIPAQTIDKSKLVFNNENSSWTLNGNRFSGYVVRFYADSTLQQKFGVVAGKRQNEFLEWYPDGHPKLFANYHQGKLQGAKKVWSFGQSHSLISHLTYHAGKLHGEQKKWYPTGEIYKILNMNMGQEEGIQRAFRKNGDLYANYEAKAGRIYGLKRAALCFGLENENIINEN